MRQSSLAVALLLLLAAGREARAARYGLLLYSSPLQQVNLSYQFNGEQQAVSSQRHETTEDYTLRMKYGLGRPSLWQGSFMAALRLDQSLVSSSLGTGSDNLSSHLGLLYDIDAVILGQSVAPGAISLKMDITQVSTPFSKSYLVKNAIYDYRWSLKNRRVPVAVEYLTGTSETSGQAVDSTRERRELYLHATHASKGFGTASLDLSNARSDFSTSSGDETFDRRYEARFQHQIGWSSQGRDRALATSANYSETAGINDAQYLALNESLQWQLGKKLRSGADYSWTGISGDPGTQTRQNGSLWFQHQLFNNLTTRVSLRARNDDYPTGSDREFGGGVLLSYVKELPKQGSLTLAGSKDYSVNDRDLGTDRLRADRETHAVAFGTRIFLTQANAVTDSPSFAVRNANRLKPTPVKDADYRISVTGALTEIVVVFGPGGAIAEGDTLEITYDYRVDPKLETVADSYGVNASVQLLGGAYRVYGNFLQSRQERTGRVTLSGLTAQSSSRLGMERKWELVTVNTEYSNFDSEADKHQAVQAQALYSKSRRDGTLTLTLSDQYQWYAPVSVGSTTLRRSAENFFSASGAYSTSLSSATSLAVNSHYLNVRGAGSSDSLSAGAALTWGLGKMSVTVNTSVGVRRQEDVINYNELFYLRVSRYF